jgi:hydroxyacylglutathione hydrolase
MFVKQFPVGGDRNFSYLIACCTTKRAIIIDPSYSPENIYNFVKKNNYSIEYIFNTHNHYDHTNGNRIIEKLTGIIPLKFGDLDPRSGRIVEDDVIFKLGRLDAKIIHTPGHTEDSICIYIKDAVFTGDTLFVGVIGGTDREAKAKAQYNSLHNKLLQLPVSTRVFPGHNYGTTSESTILNEKETNPFLLQPNFESFFNLKNNWDS